MNVFIYFQLLLFEKRTKLQITFNYLEKIINNAHWQIQILFKVLLPWGFYPNTIIVRDLLSHPLKSAFYVSICSFANLKQSCVINVCLEKKLKEKSRYRPARLASRNWNDNGANTLCVNVVANCKLKWPMIDMIKSFLPIEQLLLLTHDILIIGLNSFASANS